MRQNHLLSKLEWSPLLQSNLSNTNSLSKTPSLFSFQTKATGQFSNSKQIDFSREESFKEIRFYFEKGLKYFSISTDKQELEWGIKDESIEPYIHSLRGKKDEQEKFVLGPVRFGFSLNGNKFGALNFTVF